MQLPFFFEQNFPDSDNFVLGEDSSRHIVQVLRMKESEQLQITNGHGEVLNASVIVANKKKTEVKITGKILKPRPANKKISIAISLIKNASRFEWFLEKATEIGVSEIIPFIGERTVKQHFRYERMQNILVSAMLQSQQAWLPVLQKPLQLHEIIRNNQSREKFIAHCRDGHRKQLAAELSDARQRDQLILIGPEGDFTKEEIESALQNNYIPVSLGETRLRTETAGIVAAVLLLNKFIRNE